MSPRDRTVASVFVCLAALAGCATPVQPRGPIKATRATASPIKPSSVEPSQPADVAEISAACGAVTYPADRAILSVYDDFRVRADGSLFGVTPLIGPVWQTTGTGLPRVSAGKVVSGDGVSRAVGYLYTTLPHTPAVMWAEVSFTGDAPFAMIFSSDSTLTLRDLHHLVVTPTQAYITLRSDGGAFNRLHAIAFKSAMKTDGTVYRIGFGVHGDTSFVIGPSGEVSEASDPRVATLSGPLVVWEPSNLPGRGQSRLHAAWACPAGR